MALNRTVSELHMASFVSIDDTNAGHMAVPHDEKMRQEQIADLARLKGEIRRQKRGDYAMGIICVVAIVSSCLNACVGYANMPGDGDMLLAANIGLAFAAVVGFVVKACDLFTTNFEMLNPVPQFAVLLKNAEDHEDNIENWSKRANANRNLSPIEQQIMAILRSKQVSMNDLVMTCNQTNANVVEGFAEMKKDMGDMKKDMKEGFGAIAEILKLLCDHAGVEVAPDLRKKAGLKDPHHVAHVGSS